MKSLHTLCAFALIVSAAFAQPTRRQQQTNPYPVTVDSQAQEGVPKGERIYAIRCYREIHRCSLADAKKAVEALHPTA